MCKEKSAESLKKIMRSSSEEEFVVPMRLARTETAAEKRGISETEKVPYDDNKTRRTLMYNYS